MPRFAVLLLLLSGAALSGESTVNIEVAAKLYQDASMREQVRASLGTMPAHVRQMFESDAAAKLTAPQLDAVSSAAIRGFRIDVFEAPALQAFANHLDAATAAKAQAYLESDLGRRMVAADVALAMLGEAVIDKILSGEITAPSSPKRDRLFDKLERATHSTESTVQIFLGMGEAVAVGTAIGSGMDPAPVEQRAQQSGETNRAGLENSMRLPMRRFVAYGYRDLSDADLKGVLEFVESPAGKRYIAAYNAALNAGFDAMGRRTGEQLGESLRELAQAEITPAPRVDPPPSQEPPPSVVPR